MRILLFALLFMASLANAAVINVSNKSELIAALSSSVSGDVINVDGMAVIDLSGDDKIPIPGGITLKSNRSAHSPGALIYTTTYAWGQFIIDGPGVVIKRIRIAGPDPERRTAELKAHLANVPSTYYSVPTATGIRSSYPITIQDTEMWRWSYAAIRLDLGADGTLIQNNYIHHNQRYGLGYGIVLVKATATIRNNKFEWNRHDIAATGEPGTAYVATGNTSNYSSSHAFDMHGQGPGGWDTDIAGDSFKINSNKFLNQLQYAIKVRGVPAYPSKIKNNCILKADSAILEYGNVTVSGNEYQCY